MVTGDQLAIAVETSKRLGLGTNIMEGKALMAGATLNDELATQVNQVGLLNLSMDMNTNMSMHSREVTGMGAEA
jgi:hypothetical protein